MRNIFAYGSLMCNDIMFGVANCRVENQKATLKNYYRSKIKNEEYPGVIPCSNKEVDGVLYLNLPDSAIERLDVFEGKYYDRLDVQVCTGECREMDAMTYVIKPHYYHLLTHSEWSYTHFLEVGKQRFEAAYVGFREIMKSGPE